MCIIIRLFDNIMLLLEGFHTQGWCQSSRERKSPPRVNLEVMHWWKMKIVAFWVAEKVVWCKGKVKASSEVCLTGFKGNILPKFWKFFSSWTCHRSRADWKFMDLFQDFREGSSVLFCYFGGGVMLKRELVFIFTGSYLEPESQRVSSTDLYLAPVKLLSI